MLEFIISTSAIENTHRRLLSFKDTDIEDDDVFDRVEDLLHRQLKVAHESGQVYKFHDTYDGDYSREAYRLNFGSDNVTLIGVVGDNHHRRSADEPNKVLVTVLSYRQAAESIRSGRWVSLDGEAVMPIIQDAPGLKDDQSVEVEIEFAAYPEDDVATPMEPCKACKTCQKTLPLSAFYRDRGKYRVQCKACYRDLRKSWGQSKSSSTSSSMRGSVNYTDLDAALKEQAKALYALGDAKARVELAGAKVRELTSKLFS